jgi:putative SOS response-associated peptidase YedK
MCGRFARWRKPDEIYLPFDTMKDGRVSEASFNVAPGAEILSVILAGGVFVMTAFKWGLVPFWAKDLKTAKPFINARAETISEKPSFRKSFEAAGASDPRRTGFTNGRTTTPPGRRRGSSA